MVRDIFRRPISEDQCKNVIQDVFYVSLSGQVSKYHMLEIYKHTVKIYFDVS